MPFKNRDALTAMALGNPSSTKRGEKINPPPRPIMVRTREDRPMTVSNTAICIGIYYPSASTRMTRVVSANDSKNIVRRRQPLEHLV